MPAPLEGIAEYPALAAGIRDSQDQASPVLVYPWLGFFLDEFWGEFAHDAMRTRLVGGHVRQDG